MENEKLGSLKKGVHTLKMELKEEQKEHFASLCEALEKNTSALDTSPTGSGKTVVAIKLAKQFGIKTIVIAPPTLKKNWESTAQLENIEGFTFMSSHLRRMPKGVNDGPAVFVIIDECHFFKNFNQRSNILSEILHLPKIRYKLFISSTPFDHQRQLPMMLRLLEVGTKEEIYARSYSMKRKTAEEKVTVTLYRSLLTSEERKTYGKGFRFIKQLSYAPEAVERANNFNGPLFTKGLSLIHKSLTTALVRLVKKFSVSKQQKIIISIRFKEQFEILREHFPECLFLNGSVPQKERMKIIAKFQEPNLNHRLICVTDVIGGVGIDLDDQHGSFPRLIIALPLFLGDFLQLVGRVNRFNTKSASQVFVLQPRDKKTYFRRQLLTKSPQLEQFSTNNFVILHNMKDGYEHTNECKRQKKAIVNNSFFSKDVGTHLASFFCDCQY